VTEGFSIWIPGIVSAVVGLVAGLWTAIAVTRKETAAPDRDTALEDLEERKDNAVLLLRELEEQRDKLPTARYEAERAEIERQAVAALRARQELLVASPAAETGPAQEDASPEASRTADTERHGVVGYLASRPQLRGMLWGAAIVGVAALLYALVVDEGTPTTAAGMPPGSSSGAMAGGTQAPQSPELEAILGRLRQDPNDMDALVAGGHLLLQRMAVAQARPFIDRALQLDPEHLESLLHYAVLLAAEGNQAEGMSRLDGLLEKHPDLAEGWLFRGMFATQGGDGDLMRESFERYLKIAPDGQMAEQVKSLLAGESAPRTDAPAAHNRLWMAKCASCHGAQGSGDGRMGQGLSLPDMRTPSWQTGVTDDRIRQAIRKGVVRADGGRTRKMSAFRDLTDGQVEELVQLIRSWQGG
jgi:tetratricopeptide (TPR) repeat protein